VVLPRSTSSVRRVWVLGFLLFSGLGATWAIATPVLSNPDEPAHSVKAASVVRGELVPPKLAQPDEGPGSLLRGGFTTEVDVPYAYTYQTSELPLCYIYDAREPATCAPTFVDDDRPATWVTLTGRDPPTYYAAVGWTTLLDTGRAGFYGMRLASAAGNGALLATALAAVATLRRGRLMAVGVLVAMSPQVFILAGSINPNGLEAAAGVCAWATLAALLVHDGERLPAPLLAGAGVSCSLLALTRPLSTLWFAVIALTLLVALGRWHDVSRRWRERNVKVLVATVGVASVGGVLWTLLSDNLGNMGGYEPRGLAPWDAIQHSLRLTPAYLRQMVAAFGWQRVEGPWPLAWAWGLLVLALLGAALRWGARRSAVTAIGLLAFVVLVPTVLQAPVAESIGFTWSGRYGLAIAAGVPILATLATGLAGRLTMRTTRWIAGAAVAAFAVGQVVAHGASTRRYVVGVDGPLQYLTATGWGPPLPAVVLLLAVIALASGLAVLTFRVATDEIATEELATEELRR
jgi:hypothetical protein